MQPTTWYQQYMSAVYFLRMRTLLQADYYLCDVCRPHMTTTSNNYRSNVLPGTPSLPRRCRSGASPPPRLPAGFRRPLKT